MSTSAEVGEAFIFPMGASTAVRIEYEYSAISGFDEGHTTEGVYVKAVIRVDGIE